MFHLPAEAAQHKKHDRQTDTQTDRVMGKWSLCANLLMSEREEDVAMI